MGKCIKIICTVIALTLVYSVNANAASTDELYKIYDVPRVYNCPAEICDTIKAYNSAEQYLHKYRYIATSTVDYASQDVELSKLKSELERLTTELHNGYNMSVEELYSVEDDWIVCNNRVKAIESSRNKVVELPTVLDLSKVPTKEQFEEAVKLKQAYDNSTNVGVVTPLQKLTRNAMLYKGYSNGVTVYAVTFGDDFYAPFAGVVESVTEDTVKVDCGNNVSYSIYGLNVVSVKADDHVNQYQTLGLCGAKDIQIQLSLNKVTEDLNTLYKGEVQIEKD